MSRDQRRMQIAKYPPVNPLQNLPGNLVRTSFLRKCEGKALGKRLPSQNRAIKKPEDEVALPPAPYPLSKIALILWAFLT